MAAASATVFMIISSSVVAIVGDHEPLVLQPPRGSPLLTGLLRLPFCLDLADVFRWLVFTKLY
jgi:hypothetical protein